MLGSTTFYANIISLESEREREERVVVVLEVVLVVVLVVVVIVVVTQLTAAVESTEATTANPHPIDLAHHEAPHKAHESAAARLAVTMCASSRMCPRW